MTKLYEVLSEKVTGIELGERILVPYRGKNVPFRIWRIGYDYLGRRFIDIRLDDMRVAHELFQKMNKKWEVHYLQDTDLYKFLKEEESRFGAVVVRAAAPRRVLELVQLESEHTRARYEMIQLGKLWLPSIGELFGSIFGESNDGPSLDKEVRTLTVLPPYEVWTRSFLTKSRVGIVFTAYGCGGHIIKNSYANVQERRYMLPCMRFFV